MSKITNIPSEIRNFFSEKRRSIVMDTFTRLLESLNLDNRSLGGLKRENCQLTNLQVFQILLLLPFFAIKGFSHYDGSALCRMFGGKKDVLYSYLSQDNINWRNVIYRITNWLLTKVTVPQDHKKSLLPTALIADDTDLPKTGMHMESIGKIFSHVHQKCILGYKALMLCWSDGRTQFMLDFSLHGEKGKIEGKEQGLTSEQRNRRYERKRDKKCHIAKRKEEYFMSKGVKLLDMVKDVLTLYNQMQEDETIERGKEEIRTTLDEIASAKEVLSSVMVELSEAKQKMESTKIALIATQKSTENIVSRICNTIVKAEQSDLKVGINDEGLTQLNERNNTVIAAFKQALDEHEKRINVLFTHQQKELKRIRNIEEGAYFNGRTYAWMFGLAFISWAIILVGITIWICIKLF